MTPPSRSAGGAPSSVSDPAPVPAPEGDGKDRAAKATKPKPTPQRLGHPATFPIEVVDCIRDLLPLPAYHYVLDPFAGVGGIHRLRDDYETVGIEIESEWAASNANTILGNALHLLFDDGTFDAVATSPAYGNRLADKHEARDGSHRTTYRHMLGRPLTDDNGGGLQWGANYRTFHIAAWTEAVRVLRPGGRFVLNVKDHIRAGRWQDVAAWHIDTLADLGGRLNAVRPIVVAGNRFGANAAVRVPAEVVVSFDF